MQKNHIYNNITVCIYLYMDNIGFLHILGLQIRSPSLHHYVCRILGRCKNNGRLK